MKRLKTSVDPNIEVKGCERRKGWRKKSAPPFTLVLGGLLGVGGRIRIDHVLYIILNVKKLNLIAL